MAYDYDLPEYETHRLTNILAPVPKDSNEYKELDGSICDIGLQNPIILYQGKILVGRTRYSILSDHTNPDNGKCEIEPKFDRFEGSEDQAIQLIIDENMNRRVLDESERAMMAARLVKFHPKHNKKEQNVAWVKDRMKISPSTLSFALTLYDDKNTRHDLIEAVDKRILKVSNASKLAAYPIATVKKVLESNNPNKTAATLVKEGNRQSRQVDVARKAIQETRQSEDNGMKFGVIYADPPWKFEVRSDKGKSRSAENHYDVMNLDDIMNEDIPAASNCALFLWATTPFLDKALRVLDDWGFEYRSCMVWHKHKEGTGFWFRNTEEILLLGIKGDIPAPVPGKQPPQHHASMPGDHSEKPMIFAKIINDMFPDVPKLEMYARRTHGEGSNWWFWGNELGEGYHQHVEIITKETPAKQKRVRNRKSKKEESGVVQRNGGQEPSEPMGTMVADAATK